MTAIKDVKISPENLLDSWGAVEDWSNGDSAVPTGWVAAGTPGSIAKESTNVKAGAYSAKIISAAGATYGIEHYLDTYDALAGRTVRHGAWVKCSSASKARIYIHDSFTKTASGYHTGSGNFEFLEVGVQVGTSNTYLKFGEEVGPGTITAYFDGMIAVEGETIFTYLQAASSGNKLDVREVDVQPSTPFSVSSFDVARKEGMFVAATKIGARSIRLRAQVWGDTMAEARGYVNDLVKVCLDKRIDLYIANDRLTKVDLSGLPRLDYDANFNVWNVDLNFIAGAPYERYIGRLRKKQAINASPTSFSLINNGNFKTRPQVGLYAGTTLSTVTVENLTTGQLFTFAAAVVPSTTLLIDCELGQVLNNSVDGISIFTGEFLHLAPGTNNIRISGSTPLTANIDWFDKWV